MNYTYTYMYAYTCTYIHTERWRIRLETNLNKTMESKCFDVCEYVCICVYVLVCVWVWVLVCLYKHAHSPARTHFCLCVCVHLQFLCVCRPPPFNCTIIGPAKLEPGVIDLSTFSTSSCTRTHPEEFAAAICAATSRRTEVGQICQKRPHKEAQKNVRDWRGKQKNNSVLK